MNVFYRSARPYLEFLALLSIFSFGFGETNALSPEQTHVVIAGLIQSLHKDPTSAQQAALSLAKLGRSAEVAIPDLVDALHYDEDSVYTAISDALISIGPASLKTLRYALEDPSFIVRRRAVEIVARFGPQAKPMAPDLVQLLQDPQPDVHGAAEKALIQMGDDAIPALSGALKTNEVGFRNVLLVTLGHCGPKAVPIIVNLLKKDESPFIRSRAATTLGDAGSTNPQVIQALIASLSDMEETVRGSAATALGQLGPAAKAAIGPLRSMSESDHDALARQKAADALVQISTAAKDSLVPQNK